MIKKPTGWGHHITQVKTSQSFNMGAMGIGAVNRSISGSSNGMTPREIPKTLIIPAHVDP
jgi:hypothetical protein